jgi:hypothetical protein
VFFVLSALDLVDTIDYFQNNYQIKNFTINQCLMGHTYLRCRNLPNLIKDQVRANINRAQDKYANDLNLVGSFNNCLDELNQSQSESYQEYFDKIDQLAGTSFQSVFSELL